MPTLHRYVGTPVITRALRVLTGTSLSDSQSGYRAFWKDVAEDLDLKAPGMEYASEMLLKAGRAGLRLVDVPSDYRVRVGESKLNTFDDGWRHMRMLLLLSPHLSLILPGLGMALAGLLLSFVSLVAPAGIGLGNLQWLPVFLGPMLFIVGAEAMILGSLAAYRSPLTPPAIRRRLGLLAARNAVNRMLGSFALVALVGLTVDVALLGLWLSGQSGAALLGIAGLAQALVVTGASGIVAVFAADYTHESLGLREAPVAATPIPFRPRTQEAERQVA
jgi:hypothetical protein